MALRDIIFGPPDEVHFENLTASREVDCGPGIGKVLVRGDGVVLNKTQLVRFTGYEVEKHLKPAEVQELPDGKYLVSPLQNKVH